MMKSGRSIIM